MLKAPKPCLFKIKTKKSTYPRPGEIDFLTNYSILHFRYYFPLHKNDNYWE